MGKESLSSVGLLLLCAETDAAVWSRVIHLLIVVSVVQLSIENMLIILLIQLFVFGVWSRNMVNIHIHIFGVIIMSIFYLILRKPCGKDLVTFRHVIRWKTQLQLKEMIGTFGFLLQLSSPCND